MTTIGYSHTELEPDAETIERARAAGAAHIELRVRELAPSTPGYPPEVSAAISPQLVGFTRSIHALPGVNLGERIDRLRSASVGVTVEQVRLAESLGAGWVVVHLGSAGMASTDRRRRSRLEVAVRSVEDVLAATAGSRVGIAIENLRLLPDEQHKSYLGQEADDMIYLLGALPHSRVRAVFDIGHALITPRRPATEIWDAVRARAVAVHIHANDGLSDQHAAITDDWLVWHGDVVDYVARQVGALPWVIENYSVSSFEQSAAALRAWLDGRR